MSRWVFRLLPIFACATAAFAVGEPDAATPSAAVVPAPLQDALQKLPLDFDRWAYTETRRITDLKGHVKETVMRFDPSKPYAEQFTPLKIDGQPPTKRQLEQARKHGEERGKRIEREEAEGQRGTADPRLNLNGANVGVDLERATLLPNPPPGQLLYDIPLKNDGKATVPVEKFQLLVRLNAGSRAVENLSFKLREPFRMKLIASFKSGEANIAFTRVDPKYNTIPTVMSGDGAASIFYFINFGGKFDIKRTDFQRVKPYSEKFGVQIGPLKTLDF